MFSFFYTVIVLLQYFITHCCYNSFLIFYHHLLFCAHFNFLTFDLDLHFPNFLASISSIGLDHHLFFFGCYSFLHPFSLPLMYNLDHQILIFMVIFPCTLFYFSTFVCLRYCIFCFNFQNHVLLFVFFYIIDLPHRSSSNHFACLGYCNLLIFCLYHTNDLLYFHMNLFSHGLTLLISLHWWLLSNPCLDF